MVKELLPDHHNWTLKFVNEWLWHLLKYQYGILWSMGIFYSSETVVEKQIQNIMGLNPTGANETFRAPFSSTLGLRVYNYNLLLIYYLKSFNKSGFF